MRRHRLFRWIVRRSVLAACVVVVFFTGCSLSPASPTARPSTPTPALPTATPTQAPMTITLTSSAFHSGAYIPSLYTCDGANISPPLAWSNIPQQTVTFVLLMEDESGTGFTHWVLFNIPTRTRALPADIPTGGQLANGARQGVDDIGKIGYYGPCPTLPRGATDDYHFTLYALNVALNLGAGATIQQVTDAASGHILAQGQMNGFYQRIQKSAS